MQLCKFDVLKVVLLKIQVFWDVTLERQVVADVLQDYDAFIFRVKQPKKIREMKDVGSFKMSGTVITVT